MKRRAFITLLGGATAAWPVAARGQQRDQIPHVGYLAFGTSSTWANRIEALRVGLRELGYVEGQNVALEVRRTEVGCAVEPYRTLLSPLRCRPPMLPPKSSELSFKC